MFRLTIDGTGEAFNPAGETCFGEVMEKLSGVSIESIEPATECANPENPQMVSENWPDHIMAQAAGIVRVVSIMGK